MSMRPYPVTFHLYANDEEEVKTLQRTLYDLIVTYYKEGVYVSANTLDTLAKKAISNPFLKQYFK